MVIFSTPGTSAARAVLEFAGKVKETWEVENRLEATEQALMVKKPRTGET